MAFLALLTEFSEYSVLPKKIVAFITSGQVFGFCSGFYSVFVPYPISGFYVGVSSRFDFVIAFFLVRLPSFTRLLISSIPRLFSVNYCA
jgi:hypothetical protein